ncbi:MAG: SpoIID/LytB domain-containing protein [Mycobacteriales bacterium]
MTRGLLRSALALSVVASLGGLPARAATPSPQQVFQFDGKGYGHGVGMAQVSAQAMAVAGQSHEQILQHFYPGTSRARRQAVLAVGVWEADAPIGSVTLGTPSGARVSDGQKSVQSRPGALLQVSADGSGYHVREQPRSPGPGVVRAVFTQESPTPTPEPVPSVLPSTTPTPTVSPGPTTSPTPSPTGSPSPSTAASPTPSPTPTGPPLLVFDSTQPITVTPPSGALTEVRDTGRAYRGEVQALARQGFRLVNFVDIEDYLRGLGEVPASWRPAALQVQAVAARTYALRATGQGRPLGYDLCADTRCQVYIGAGNERETTTAAARATRGEVVTFGGRLATTYYSANAGGRTASPGEGFGGSETSPYLPSNVVAPGDVDSWRVTPSPETVAARLGYAGRLDAVTVIARGVSGRATRVRLDGSAGSVELAGVVVARGLSLRSSLFTVARTTGVAEALPEAAAPTQLPPGLLAEELAHPDQTPLAEAAPAATGTALVDSGPDALPTAALVVAWLLILLSGAGAALVGVRQGVTIAMPTRDGARRRRRQI